MKVGYSKKFLNQYKKLAPNVRQKVDERILLWQNNLINPQLRNHKLTGKYKQYWSIDITGDYRAFYLHREDKAIFDMVGAHSQLYG